MSVELTPSQGAADPTRAAQRKLARNDPTTPHGRASSNPHALSVPPSHSTRTALSPIVVMQQN